MALRRDIKAVIRGEISTAVGSAIPDERILYTSQETRDVDYPRIIYMQVDTPLDLYGTKPAPYRYERDADGQKETAVYAEHYTAIVDISMQGTSLDTDSLYEDVRTQFSQYQLYEDPSALHDDITDVMLSDAESDPNRDTEPTTFDTMVSVEVAYRRDVARDGTPIEEVHQNYDVDDNDDDTVGDGTTDVSYTTT